MSAAAFPKWVMLDRYVFRRDDEDSFPGDNEAPIRATGTTSWGAPFRVAFVLAEPPLASRLFAHLPGFPDPREQRPVAVLASHRHLLLLRVGIQSRELGFVQDLFIYSAATDSDRAYTLKALPHCTLPQMDYDRRDGRLLRRRPEERRVLTVQSLGILCGGGDDEKQFVLAEIKILRFNRIEVYADIYWLASSTSSADAGQNLAGEWKCKRVPISSAAIVGDDDNKYTAKDDVWQLYCWKTDTVIPFGRWLCCVDYHRGILLCDVYSKPAPTVSFLRFPLDKFPVTSNRSQCSTLYRSASAMDDALKFVDVARDDGIGLGELEPDAGFTVTCHTLTVTAGSGSGDGMVWKWSKDWVVTSAELWAANPPHLLPREILLLPQVDIERPHVLCFLLVSEYRYVMRKMWLVAIDMNTKTVESLSQYTNGMEDRETENAEFTSIKSCCDPQSFLPCEFPKFFHISRKRKDME